VTAGAASVSSRATGGGALRTILANRRLRRIEAAWALGVAGDAAFTVAILVAAYEVAGAAGVGVLSFVRMAPSIVGAPLAGLIAGRRPPTDLLFGVHGLRAIAAILVTVVLATGLPAWIALGAATIAASAGAFVRPLQSAAMPAMAGTPEELVAANSLSLTGEGIGAFVGPLVAGLLVALDGPVAAAIAGSALFAVGALSLTRIEPTEDERAFLAQTRAAADPAPITLGTVARELTAGLRVLRRRPSAGIVLFGFASQVFVRGLMTTLTVVTAIDLVGLGEPGVGTLNAAYGLGTLSGALVAVRLAGRRELAPTFAVSLSLWGLPIAVIAALPRADVAILALLVTGVANAVLDVAGFTLLQRTVRGSERVPVFGVLESTAGFGIGVGGAVAPLLVAALGSRGALGLAGAILPIVAVGAWRQLRAVDRAVILPDRELGLLRGIPLFARLPLTALERLAEAMRPRRVGAGERLMTEGEPGSEYDVIAEGRFEVLVGDRPLTEVGPGDGVGEIALLRPGPRTATVAALTDGVVYTLDCAAFRAAVAGPTSAAAAAAIIEERLARSAGATESSAPS
jgi:MFS family permease